MVNRIKYIVWLALLPVIINTGCNDLLAPDTERLGYEYFPINVGDYRIYDIEVINYNLDGGIDTITFQLREEVADSSIIGKETSYRLDRYLRADLNEPWVIDSVWSARLNTYQAVIVENNVPIIKLSFPLSEDKRWDGNALNSKEFDEFKIKNLGLPYMVNDIVYANSLEMYKEDLRDPLGITRDDYQLEVYSVGLGLIYKLDEDIQYCDNCPEQFTIEYGLVSEQKLLEIGNIK